MNGRMQRGERVGAVEECVNASLEKWMNGRLEMGWMDDWRIGEKKRKRKEKMDIKSIVWREGIEGKRWKERKSWRYRWKNKDGRIGGPITRNHH